MVVDFVMSEMLRSVPNGGMLHCSEDEMIALMRSGTVNWTGAYFKSAVC